MVSYIQVGFPTHTHKKNLTDEFLSVFFVVVFGIYFFYMILALSIVRNVRYRQITILIFRPSCAPVAKEAKELFVNQAFLPARS